MLARRDVQASLRLRLRYVALLLGLVWFLFPLAWLFLGSIKSFDDLNQIPPRLLPTSLYLDNYPAAWNAVPFALYFRNTIVVVALSTLGEVVSSSLVGYGFARLRFWGRDALFAVMISTMMLPFWVLIIPQFLVFKQLGWVNTWLPLILPAYFGYPSYIFLMRQFFLTLPPELDEAAEIDGCGTFGIYWRILLPLCKPALATVAIFTFMGAWNAFVRPVIFLNDPKLYTASIGLAFMRFMLGQGQPVQGLVLAASVFTSIPLVLVFFVGQRFIVRGIALTGRTGM